MSRPTAAACVCLIGIGDIVLKLLDLVHVDLKLALRLAGVR